MNLWRSVIALTLFVGCSPFEISTSPETNEKPTEEIVKPAENTPTEKPIEKPEEKPIEKPVENPPEEPPKALRPVIFVVVMENHSADQIYGNTAHAPYLNGTLIPVGAHAINYADDLPLLPSEPHYIWMEAGTNVFPDWTSLLNGDPSATNSTDSPKHLSTQISAAGLNWRSYQEGMNATTGACPIKSSGYYAAKHNPFIFFTDVAGDPPTKDNAKCAAHHAPLTQLATDLAGDKVADYNFITPDLCNDMHGATGCPPDSVLTGDTWLAAYVPLMLAYIDRRPGIVIITWDEPESAGNIPLIIVGSGVKPNYTGRLNYSHSSFLKTVETILGLPILDTVASASDLADLFNPEVWASWTERD